MGMSSRAEDWLRAGEVLRDPHFELDRFIIRSVYLGVVATLLGYIGAYERRLRGDLGRLATWPSTVLHEGSAAVGETLAHVAATMHAPRVLMTWEDPEEPWTHVAIWSGGDSFRWTREPPGTYEPLVPPALEGADFLCVDAGAAAPAVLRAGQEGPAHWTGEPVHPGLRERFEIHAVLGLVLHGEFMRGRLLVLDRSGMASDDLMLGGIVARQVTARMDQLTALERLRVGAETDARIGLARDLHDGLMQSLTAAGLQIEAARVLIGTDPAAAAGLLREVQRVLAEEQRDLRTLLRDLKPGASMTPPDVTLPARLHALRARIERQWGLRVAMEADDALARLPRHVAQDVHLIVHEAVVNTARHGRATTVDVRAMVKDGHVRIVVVDDGRGFPFRGRREHATLSTESGRPVTLWSRVDALGGTLTVDSSEGACTWRSSCRPGRRGWGVPVRLVLADDHPIVLDGLERLFDAQEDFAVVARCLDGAETLRAVRQHRPDVVVLDVRMPELDGFAILRDIQREGLPTRVVLLTAALDEDEVLEAIRLGVRGVVLKEIAPRMLVECVRKVVAGEQWIERRSLARALDTMLRREAGLREVTGVLTPREIEIVRLVAGGLRNQAIAEQLHISEGTVKVHLHHIYEKLGVDSRVALTVYARDKRLV
jgi:DNA-binding NarL/FixJ family response regulator/signal transduction histidine kinase